MKYPLGSDEGKNCDKLGIWIEKSMYGRKYFGIDRSTFVMDKNGKILNSWNKVKVKGHVEEVYNFCKDQWIYLILPISFSLLITNKPLNVIIIAPIIIL